MRPRLLIKTHPFDYLFLHRVGAILIRKLSPELRAADELRNLDDCAPADADFVEVVVIGELY